MEEEKSRSIRNIGNVDPVSENVKRASILQNGENLTLEKLQTTRAHTEGPPKSNDNETRFPPEKTDMKESTFSENFQNVSSPQSNDDENHLTVKTVEKPSSNNDGANLIDDRISISENHKEIPTRTYNGNVSLVIKKYV